jgi:4'-phosphopantetheinyl transferase
MDAGRDEPRHTIAMTTAPSCPGPGEVQAWYAGTHAFAGDPARISRWLARLRPEERRRYDQLRLPADRSMFLLGRAMARVLVGRALELSPADWTWSEGPRGRPQIADPVTTLRFNLAHSAGLVVCGLATGRDVGVDVEDLDRRQADPAVIRRYCSPAEADDILGRGDAWHERFLEYWTLKEAYLKARGLGIAVPLADVSFSLEPEPIRIEFLGRLTGTDARWAFHLTRATDRHVVAVAADAADGARPAIRFEELAARAL